MNEVLFFASLVLVTNERYLERFIDYTPGINKLIICIFIFTIFIIKVYCTLNIYGISLGQVKCLESHEGGNRLYYRLRLPVKGTEIPVRLLINAKSWAKQQLIANYKSLVMTRSSLHKLHDHSSMQRIYFLKIFLALCYKGKNVKWHAWCTYQLGLKAFRSF